jgi:type I restriction enzyme S subunit
VSFSNSTEKDLPLGWRVSPLEDVVDILDGKRVPINAKERETRTGQVPYYGATGQVGWIDDYLFDEELVLLGEDGAPFLDSSKPKAYVIRGKSWVNNHAHVLRAKDGTPNAYLKYFLDRFDYHGFVTGTTRLKLTQGAMRQIPVPLPSPEERKRIVAEIEKQFSRLDEAVANLIHTKANLKRHKAALLKAAVEGKLTEAWRKQHPNIEPATKLLERILTERRAKWSGRGKNKAPLPPETSDLPSLPNSWAWATVEQVSTLVQYGSSAKTHEEAIGVPVLRMGNIEDGRLQFDSLKYLPKKHDEFPELFLREGDILFNRTNSAELVGKTAVYKGKPTPCSFASYLIRVRLAQGCAPDLLAYFINSVFGRAWIAKVVSQQVGQANVNGTKLQALAVPLPPFDEQRQIVAEVERRLSVINELESTVEANLARAQRLKQSILEASFAGRLV